jgi:hypothetical protein
VGCRPFANDADRYDGTAQQLRYGDNMASRPHERVTERLLWLRLQVARRKWILWVSLVVLALVAFQIVLMLVPHHGLNTLVQYEQQSDGVRESQ